MGLVVLVMSPNKDLPAHFQSMAEQIYPGQYSFEHIDPSNTTIPDSDVAMVDTSPVDDTFTKRLSSVLSRFDPRPVICIVNNTIDGELMNVIKRYASDFLVLSRITAPSLHNSVRYAMKSSELQIDLVNQEQRYISLFNNSVDASFFLNADFQIQAANHIFSDLFGFADEDWLGGSFSRLLRRPEEFETIRCSLLKNDTIEAILRLSRQNRKSRFTGKLSISVIRDTFLEKGRRKLKINGYHGTLKNITRSARLAEIESKANRVSETYRLARTLAHEIRNPLTTIGLSVEQLKEDLRERSDSLLYTEIIERCTTRINNLISELLSASENVATKKQHLDLNDLVKRAFEFAADRAQLLEVDILLDIETEQTFIQANNTRMNLAVSNLLSNALDSIEGKSGRVIIGTYFDDNFYCIYVEDNGSGMDEIAQERLFDPFFTQKKNGIGLGLTTAQTIVSEHNGYVEVESAVGMGSTLTISLPIANGSKLSRHHIAIS